MNEDLKIIKKKYGENMMKLCRELFPTILEQEGLLSQTMLEHFEPSHELYNDIMGNDLSGDFKNYICNIIEISEQIKEEVNKTPEELLASVGYDLYECSSEEEIQQFKKYYREDESLCTFRGNRLDKCYVFFAVKKNVDEIKRKDFDKPQRQDLYGTSVISIQFTKDEAHTLSIKNRYNHTVSNPDSTFSNNLDNIVPGLTKSFEKYYGMVQKHKDQGFEMPNYVCVNGKYYKYNYEINNIYYCPNNIIIDNFEVHRLPKEKYLLFDYFILDLVNKKVSLYDKIVDDSFVDGFNDIDTIEIKRYDDGKIIVIKNSGDDIVIKIDNDNKIIGYTNNNIEEIIDTDFLSRNQEMEELSLSKVRTICGCFLRCNKKLKKLFLPEVETISYSFLEENQEIEELSLPKAKTIGNDFLFNNEKLKKLFVPEVETIGDDFLKFNQEIEELSLPRAKTIGNRFFSNNEKLKRLFMPEVETIGFSFLMGNLEIEELSLPKAKTIGNNFLFFNKKLRRLFMPEVKTIGNRFLEENQDMEELSLPKAKTIGDFFLFNNKKLRKLFMPEVKTTGEAFLLSCNSNVKNKMMIKK